MSKLQDLLALSHIPRWVTHPVQRRQSVAEHSYRVACIALALIEEGGLRKHISLLAVLEWALIHDAPEAKIGDIPSPVKQMIPSGLMRTLEANACPWREGEIPKMGDPVEAVVHLADTIEAYSWVMKYGSAFRDRFDDNHIPITLKRRINEYAVVAESKIPGINRAVLCVMEQIK